MLKVADEENIPLVDLTQRSIDVCNSFGIEGAKSLFLWVAAGEYTGAYAGGASDSTHLLVLWCLQVRTVRSTGNSGI